MTDVRFTMENGDPRTAQLTVGGEVVPTVEVSIHVDTIESKIEAILPIMEVNSLTSEAVQWYGLENIPTSVLQEVIDRRNNE